MNPQLIEISAATLLNAGICLSIALRLITFKRGDKAYRPIASMMAYLLIVASGAIGIMSLSGQYIATWFDVVLHGAILLAFIESKGNLVDIFRTAEGERAICKWLRKIKHGNSPSRKPR